MSLRAEMSRPASQDTWALRLAMGGPQCSFYCLCFPRPAPFPLLLGILHSLCQGTQQMLIEWLFSWLV